MPKELPNRPDPDANNSQWIAWVMLGGFLLMILFTGQLFETGRRRPPCPTAQ